MLVTNSPPDRHFGQIAAQMRAPRRADLMVSYIRRSGVAALRAEVARLCEDGGVRLICSFDMGITDPEAVRQLKNVGADVRIFESGESGRRGTFHPKIWLFESPEARWSCLIGSANFTAGALFDNVEAGVLLKDGETVRQARDFFETAWKSPGCHSVDDAALDKWAGQQRARAAVGRRVALAAAERNSDQDVHALEEFVSGWINIGVDKTTEGAGRVIGKQWRGWYVIPDQGEIDGGLMDRLSRICKIIRDSGETLDISRQAAPSPALDMILKITAEKLLRESRKMSLRDLFVRQEKNYLLRLGFAEEFRKNELALTRHGHALAEARDETDTMRVHAEAMEGYVYNGLNLLEFARRLLAQTRRLDFVEFSFFACHAWAMDEVDTVASLVRICRRLPEDRRRDFVAKMDGLFKNKLEPTAKNVRGNYDKKIRHTMSALGWCEGLHYDPEKKEIRLSDGE